jgi:hypothetical protein
MKRNTLLVLVASGAIALAAWQLAPAGPTEEPVPTAPTTTTPAAPAPAAGYRAHVDFDGQFTEEAPPVDAAELNKALEQMIDTSSEGVVEKPSPVPGGGVMVELNGRFQASMAAVIDADGKLTVPCVTNESEVQAVTGADSDAQKDKE